MKLETYQIVTISSWVAKIIQAIIQILTIQLLTTILDVNQYATYTLLFALFYWVALSDFGLSVSLQNLISKMRTQNNLYDIYIGNIFFLLIVVFFVLSILFYWLSYFFAPYYLQNFNTDDIKKIKIFYLSIEFFLITALSSVVYKIYFALHKGYISNLMPALGSIFTYIIFLYFTSLKNAIDYDDLLLCSIIISFAPMAFMTFLLAVLFTIKNGIKIIFNSKTSKKLVQQGLKFWFCTILLVLISQIDYIVISFYLTPNDTIIYNTISRIYLFGFFIYSSLLMALWPMVSEYLYKGMWNCAFRYIKIYLPIGIIFMIFFSIIFYFTSESIFKLLIKNTKISLDFYTTLIFCIYFCIKIWTDSFIMILQSINVLKPFWVILPIQILLNIIFQVFFSKQFGMIGIIYGLMLSFLLTTAWYLPYKVRLMYLNNAKI